LLLPLINSNQLVYFVTFLKVINYLTLFLKKVACNGVVGQRSSKKEGVAESCKFPTEDIMGVQNINFASKSPKMGIFSSRFCSFERKFSDKKKNAID